MTDAQELAFVVIGVFVLILLLNGRPSRHRRRQAEFDAHLQQAIREKEERDG